MADLALDPETGDLAIENGRLQLVRGADAIEQDWELRLGTLLGEWYRDQLLGMDVELLSGKLTRSRKLQIRAMVTRETLKVRELSEVVGVHLDLDGTSRQLRIEVLARVSSGEALTLTTTAGVE